MQSMLVVGYPLALVAVRDVAWLGCRSSDGGKIWPHADWERGRRAAGVCREVYGGVSQAARKPARAASGARDLVVVMPTAR